MDKKKKKKLVIGISIAAVLIIIIAVVLHLQGKKQGSTLNGKSTKIKDMGADISSGGRLDRYWHIRGFDEIYKVFKAHGLSKEEILESEHILTHEYKLKGLDFGNWVKNNYRYNYLACLLLSLKDLDKVLKFNKNVGLNRTLGISIGARGKGGANAPAAHFEPSTFIINLTRFEEVPEAKKPEYFARTGGVGALAHEYGHFLDFFFGTFVEKKNGSRCLTNGKSIHGATFVNNERRGTLRFLANDVIEKCIFQSPGTYTKYYKTLLDVCNSDYWFRHEELFARAFEQYVGYKLNGKSTNYFLWQKKYEENVYMSKTDLERVVPLFDKLLVGMRKYM